MLKKQYIVKLTNEEPSSLVTLTKKGKIAAQTLARAHILRLADEDKLDAEIAATLGMDQLT
jgi:Mn-dependent DtxR family transcriptional regulator